MTAGRADAGSKKNSFEVMLFVSAENSALKRLDIYRQKRIRRKKNFAAIILFIFLLTGGILVVDRSVNGLVSGYDGFALAAFESHGTTLEIKLMNRRFTINTEYLSRDLERLINFFSSAER